MARTRSRSDAELTASPTRAVTLLVVLTLLGLGVGMWLLVAPPQSEAEASEPRRQEAIAAASKFGLALNSFDVTDIDAYRERVSPLLTDEFTEQFEASTRDILTAYAETGLRSQGTVRQAAVESIDPDSAAVLLALDVTTLPEGLTDLAPRFRWAVSLVERDDQWLVDDFRGIDVPEQAVNEPPEPADEEGQ